MQRVCHHLMASATLWGTSHSLPAGALCLWGWVTCRYSYADLIRDHRVTDPPSLLLFCPDAYRVASHASENNPTVSSCFMTRYNATTHLVITRPIRINHTVAKHRRVDLSTNSAEEHSLVSCLPPHSNQRHETQGQQRPSFTTADL